MIEKDDDERRLSIGELARATGMTVRALRHYDEIGLLRASERTVSRHRRYTTEDLRWLRRVRALRDLAMPLDEIRGVLGASPQDMVGMRSLLASHLDELTAQADCAPPSSRRGSSASRSQRRHRGCGTTTARS